MRRFPVENPAHPLISVIMPAYNADRFIEAAISSIMAQTCTRWELIIVDDASTDSTPEIARRFDDPRIRYNRTERIGSPSGVRNVGLRLAQGKYIAFLDADDLYFPDTLERLLRILESDPKATAVYGFPSKMSEDGITLLEQDFLIPIPSGGARLNPNYRHTWEGILMGNISCLLPGLMLRKETLDRVGLFNEELCGPEDYEFYVRLFLDNFEGIRCLPDYVYRYRVYFSSLTKDPERVQRVLESSIQIMDWLFTHPDLPGEAKKVRSKGYTECYRYCSREWLLQGRNQLAREIALACLENPFVQFSDWCQTCLPLVVRSFIPPLLNGALATLRWRLRSRLLALDLKRCSTGSIG